MRIFSFERIDESETIDTKHVSEKLNDPKLLALISQLPVDQRSTALGTSLEYIILFPKEDVLQYLKELSRLPLFQDNQYGEEPSKFRKQKTALLIERAADVMWGQRAKTNLGRIETSEKLAQELYTFFKNKFVDNGFYYHGFNPIFEESIRMHGIDPASKNTCQEDMEAVRVLFEKIDPNKLHSVLGWWTSNAQSVFFTDHLDLILHYSSISPEWFHLFVASNHLLEKDSSREKLTTYLRRDYAQARKNIEDLCNNAQKKDGSHITPEQKQMVLSFFEKHWNMFVGADATGRVALIRKNAPKDYLEQLEIVPKKLSQFRKQSTFRKNYSTIELIDELISPNSQDASSDNPISPKDIEIVTLPALTSIFKPHELKTNII